MIADFPLPSLHSAAFGGIRALTDEALFAACGVRIAFTERRGGVSEGPYASLNTASHVGDDLSCVQRNRAIAFRALGFPDAPCVIPNQVHGTDIARVASASDVPRATAQADAGADAVLVETPGVAALLNFADCLPLVIVAPSGRFVVAHAGWRGALAGIAGKAARALAAEACEGDAPAGFNAYIGPHIGPECFETSAEMASQFADRYGVEVLDDPRHVSLARAVTTDLVAAGLSADRIADAGICTVCNTDRFFSYRAENTCGRHAAIAIKCANGTAPSAH